MSASAASNPFEDPEDISKEPPWTCHGESHWFISYNHKSLPTSSIDPRDYPQATIKPNWTDRFRGDIALIQLVRYTDTPAGSYDELIWTPGRFTAPNQKSKRGFNRVTRIYVSGKETMKLGRRSFGIPKHLAEFEFTDHSVVVFPPGRKEEPFFMASWRPMLGGVKMPMNLSWLPVENSLVQPPLAVVEDEEGAEGTDAWLKYKVGMKGWVNFEKCELVPGIGGDMFPDVKDVGCWTTAIHWTNVTFTFAKGEPIA